MNIEFTQNEFEEFLDAQRAIRRLLSSNGLSTDEVDALIGKLLDHRTAKMSSANMPKLPSDEN